MECFTAISSLQIPGFLQDIPPGRKQDFFYGEGLRGKVSQIVAYSFPSNPIWTCQNLDNKCLCFKAPYPASTEARHADKTHLCLQPGLQIVNTNPSVYHLHEQRETQDTSCHEKQHSFTLSTPQAPKWPPHMFSIWILCQHLVQGFSQNEQGILFTGGLVCPIPNGLGT